MQSAGWSVLVGGADVDPYGYHTKLIELAYQMASAGASGDAETLRRFRVIYRHLAATVDGVMVELGQGPFGPMAGGMPGMPMPDASKLMDDTDKGLESL